MIPVIRGFESPRSPPGYSAAWSAHLLWEQGAVGSNPTIPTMKRRRRVKVNEMAEQKVEEKSELLDTLGLEPQDEVRFRYSEDQNWVKGKVTGENRDGSLLIYETGDYAKARSIMPQLVQKKLRGPRGGVLWEYLDCDY